ncbi:hypothetical protein NL676_022153 [Syzygium grande]|nr:hypothetical protein NL676_022153 [Syzygium grande]
MDDGYINIPNPTLSIPTRKERRKERTEKEASRLGLSPQFELSGRRQSVQSSLRRPRSCRCLAGFCRDRTGEQCLKSGFCSRRMAG